MYDLLNRLIVNIPGVQKYLRLTTLSMEQFLSLNTEEDLLSVFNYHSVAENFGFFSHIYFKTLLNITTVVNLHNFMSQFWILVYSKVQ